LSDVVVFVAEISSFVIFTGIVDSVVFDAAVGVCTPFGFESNFCCSAFTVFGGDEDNTVSTASTVKCI
jgi:hypothetical protein